MALVQFGTDFPIPALQRELERFLANPAINLGLSGQGAYPPINVFDDGAGTVVVRRFRAWSRDKSNLAARGAR